MHKFLRVFMYVAVAVAALFVLREPCGPRADVVDEDRNDGPRPFATVRWDRRAWRALGSFGKPLMVTYPCTSKSHVAGTVNQLRYAFESLVLATTVGAVWAPTPMGVDVTRPCTVPLWEVIDYERIAERLGWVVWRDGNLGASAFQKVSACEGKYCMVGTSAARRHMWNVFDAVQPSKRLMTAVHLVRPLVPYVCLHARVEKDFAGVFRGGSRFKSAAEIARTITEGGGLFPPGMALYLAGGDVSEVRAELATLDPHRFTGVVYSHDETLFGEEEVEGEKDPQKIHHRESRGREARPLSSLEWSLVDLEVCKTSTVHVGTAGSIWSEWVHDVRWVRREASSWMYAGAHPQSTLLRFEGTNDDRFFGTSHRSDEAPWWKGVWHTPPQPFAQSLPVSPTSTIVLDIVKLHEMGGKRRGINDTERSGASGPPFAHLSSKSAPHEGQLSKATSEGGGNNNDENENADADAVAWGRNFAFRPADPVDVASVGLDDARGPAWIVAAWVERGAARLRSPWVAVGVERWRKGRVVAIPRGLAWSNALTPMVEDLGPPPRTLVVVLRTADGTLGGGIRRVEALEGEGLYIVGDVEAGS